MHTFQDLLLALIRAAFIEARLSGYAAIGDAS